MNDGDRSGRPPAVEEVYAVADPDPDGGGCGYLLFARADDGRVYHVGGFDAADLRDEGGLAVPSRATDPRPETGSETSDGSR